MRSKKHKKEFGLVFIIIIFSVGIFFAFQHPSITGYATYSGVGTEEDPFQITNCTELQDMDENLDSYFILMNDIDCSESVGWNAGAGFDPIGSGVIMSGAYFTGNLNGNNHTINGLYINVGSNNAGLIGKSRGATIRDLGLVDLDITGGNYLGGLAGYSYYYSYIDNVYTSGVVHGNENVGGLIGKNGGSNAKYSTVNNSHSHVTVYSNSDNAGGLVGYNLYSRIDNSYATGNVTSSGSYDNVGGLVGFNYVAQIDNCYANGTIQGGDYTGGLVGKNMAYGEWDSNITDSNATGSVTGSYYTGGLVGQNLAQGYYYGYPYYAYNSGHAGIDNCYASGTVDGDEEVGGLVGFDSATLGSHADITNSHATGSVSGDESVGGLVGKLTAYQQYYYTLAGSASVDNSYATGNVTGSGNNNGGLVGESTASYYNQYASVDNSYANGTVTATSGYSEYTGGLVGYNNGMVDNSYADGDVTSQGTRFTGGLVGYSEGPISSSHATGSVTGYGSYVAGLVGSNNEAITESYATGSVTANGYNSNKIGGLVGDNRDSIDDSYATGSVTADGYYSRVVGGLVGDNANVITNSFATGKVNVSGEGSYRVGGLVGYNSNIYSSSVDNCYASGDVYAEGASSNEIGGVVGRNNRYVTDSFAVGKVSGHNSVGGIVGSDNVDFYSSYPGPDGPNSVDNSYWYNNSEGSALNCVGSKASIGSNTDCDFVIGGTGGLVASTDNLRDITNVPITSWSFPPWDDFCNTTGYPSLDWQNLTILSLCPGFSSDITAPAVTINQPVNSTNVTSKNLSLVLQASFGEVVSSAWYTVDSLSQKNSLCTTCDSKQVLIALTTYGTHLVSVFANDSSGNVGNKSSEFFLQADSDGDGNPDSNETDSDNDGINNTDDHLQGSLTNVNTNIPLNISVGGSDNLSQNFTGTQTVIFTNTTDTIVEFEFDFSSKTLDLSNVTIEDTSTITIGSVLVAGIDLTGTGETKTVYVPRVDTTLNAVCIEDAEIASISQVSSACTGTGEVKVQCDATAQTGYTCTYDTVTNRYKVEGLIHSGVSQLSYTRSSGSASSGGGVGGSGGSSTINLDNQPKTLLLGANNRVSFIANSEKHYIDIRAIYPDRVTIRVYSPIEQDIYLNQPVKIDADGDGTYDIMLTLLEIRMVLAKILFEKISETAPVIEAKPPVQKIMPGKVLSNATLRPSQLAPSGKAAETAAPATAIEPAVEKKPSNTWTLLGFLAFAVILAIIVMFILFEKNKNKRPPKRAWIFA